MGDKDDSSTVLWVGFPLYLDVTERMLEEAFSPFGRVVRIRMFSGRTYSFVEMETRACAERARVALDHVLFNDERVHIKFAKSDMPPPIGDHRHQIEGDGRGRRAEYSSRDSRQIRSGSGDRSSYDWSPDGRGGGSYSHGPPGPSREWIPSHRREERNGGGHLDPSDSIPSKYGPHGRNRERVSGWDDPSTQWEDRGRAQSRGDAPEPKRPRQEALPYGEATGDRSRSLSDRPFLGREDKLDGGARFTPLSAPVPPAAASLPSYPPSTPQYADPTPAGAIYSASSRTDPPPTSTVPSASAAPTVPRQAWAGNLSKGATQVCRVRAISIGRGLELEL